MATFPTGDENEDGVESQQGMGLGLFDDALTTPGADDLDEYPANSPVLHVALSARLGLDPSEMAMYRSDMFPPGAPLPCCQRPAAACTVSYACSV